MVPEHDLCRLRVSAVDEFDEADAPFEQSPGDTARALAYVAALERTGDNPAALAAIERSTTAGADAFAMHCARANVLGATLKYDDAARTNTIEAMAYKPV